MSSPWIFGGVGAVAALAALGFGLSAAVPPTVSLTETAPQVVTVTDGTMTPEDPAFDAAVRDALLRNPGILLEVQTAYQAQLEAEQAETQRVAISALGPTLFDNPDAPVLGNADGDVTVVEFFDYNCGFCKRAHADLTSILAEDDQVKFVLKEFPILGQDSYDAHRVAIAFHRLMPELYGPFHDALMELPSQADEASAFMIATSLGADADVLRTEMNSPAIRDIVATVHGIAEALSITGTPAYVIGNEVISGAVGADTLKARIEAVRAARNQG